MEGMVAAVAQRPRSKIPLEGVVAQLRDGVHAMSDWVREANGQELGEGLIQIREAGIDSLEAVFADGLRRFDESGDYAADGALSVIAWLKWRCKLSGGAASERVGIAKASRALAQDRRSLCPR